MSGNMEKNETVTICHGLRHVPKLRKALADSNGLLAELAKMDEWGDAANCQISDNSAALAAPIRNCDRFGDIPGDAVATWLKEDPAAKYMNNEEQNAVVVFAMWAFSKVKEKT